MQANRCSLLGQDLSEWTQVPSDDEHECKDLPGLVPPILGDRLLNEFSALRPTIRDRAAREQSCLFRPLGLWLVTETDFCESEARVRVDRFYSSSLRPKPRTYMDSLGAWHILLENPELGEPFDSALHTRDNANEPDQVRVKNELKQGLLISPDDLPGQYAISLFQSL